MRVMGRSLCDDNSPRRTLGNWLICSFSSPSSSFLPPVPSLSLLLILLHLLGQDLTIHLKLASNSQSFSLILPNTGITGMYHHTRTCLLLDVLPPIDRSENHGPLASFPLYSILLNYSQVPLFTLFSVATNLTLHGKLSLSPVILCLQNTELDKSVFWLMFPLAKLANEFADFKDTSSSMKEEERWVH